MAVGHLEPLAELPMARYCPFVRPSKPLSPFQTGFDQDLHFDCWCLASRFNHRSSLGRHHRTDHRNCCCSRSYSFDCSLDCSFDCSCNHFDCPPRSRHLVRTDRNRRHLHLHNWYYPMLQLVPQKHLLRSQEHQRHSLLFAIMEREALF